MDGQLIPTRPTGLSLKPLTRVSPSLGASLQTCELAVAFRLDKRYAFLDTSAPASVLGTVAHELAELTASGRFDSIADDQLEAELDRAWLVTLAPRETDFANEHPFAPVPAPQRWPGYQQTRVRTLTLLAHEIRQRRASASGSSVSASPLLEIPLKPDGIPLHGRADRVERHGNEVDIVDLKTGWTLGDELKPAHRKQLLAYAYLWHATHNEWPTTASIQRLDGTRISFVVDPNEAEAAAAELIAALNVFNQHIATEDIQALASPGAAACRHCSYRAVCRPFFNDINPDWDWWKVCCIGTVTSVAKNRAAGRLTVDVLAGNTSESAVNVINVPAASIPPLGAVISIVDAIRRRPSQDLQLTWETTLCRWADGGF